MNVRYLWVCIGLLVLSIMRLPAQDPSAVVDFESNDKGILIPRMSETEKEAIMQPAQGLLIYQTTIPQGFNYYDGTEWIPLNGFEHISDLDGDTRVYTEKNPDEDRIRFDMNGQEQFVLNGPRIEVYNSGRSLFLGEGAGANDDLSANHNVYAGFNSGHSSTSGEFNAAFGNMSMSENKTGSYNAAFGSNALFSNNTGNNNSAFGNLAMYSNISGSNNAAFGRQALYFNIMGDNNAAFGNFAMNHNTQGGNNSAFGSYALSHNTVGYNNAAFGRASLDANVNGYNNAAFGALALLENEQGHDNTAHGYEALRNNISGYRNTSVGSSALKENTVGEENAAVGHAAMLNNVSGNRNTAIGTSTLSSNVIGSDNTVIGYSADLTGDNVNNATAIGANTIVDASNKVQVGNAMVLSIGGQVNWSAFSDRRIKKDLREDVPGLSFISRLRPVSYRFDSDRQMELQGQSAIDSEYSKQIEQRRFTGFIAQEVQEVADELGFDFSGIDSTGMLMGLRYAEFVVPLVKALQEQNSIIEIQNQRLNDLEQTVLELSGSVELLREQLEAAQDK